MTNNKEKYRKGFEEEIMKNWGEAFQDFTPWGTNSGNSLPPSEFQYAEDGVNALWLIWCAAKQQSEQEIQNLKDSYNTLADSYQNLLDQTPEKSEWISCKDELPPSETLIIGLYLGHHVLVQILLTDDYHEPTVWVCEDHSVEYDLEDITHWQSLPEPPTNTQGDV